MNSELLQKIKPKRLDNRYFAYIFEDQFLIDFRKSFVYINGPTEIKSDKCIEIGVKDLFDDDFESATKLIKPKYEFNNKFNEVTIDANDLLLFSVISSIGEDLFLLSDVKSFDDRTEFVIFGLNYSIKYIVRKNYKLNGHLHYSSYYYLFQMFKHLSGKKADILYTYYDDSSIRLHNNIINMGIKQISSLNYNNIFNEVYGDDGCKFKDVDKKSLIEANSTQFKHVSRLFGDIVSVSEKEHYDIFKSDNCLLYLNKVKDNG